MYGKITDGVFEIAPKNYRTENDIILNFDLDEELMQEYGFKPIIEAEKPDYPYILTYEEDEEEIREVLTPDINAYKQRKIFENDTLRDDALLGGVTYSNVLFDSDTDQKINLSEQYKRMSDTDTVVWHGMNNVDLLCTKSDLQAIGDLIYDLTAFVWENNAYIKEQIQNAETIEELNEIEISYDRDDT